MFFFVFLFWLCSISAVSADTLTYITHVSGPDQWRGAGTDKSYPIGAGKIRMTDGDGTFQEDLAAGVVGIMGWDTDRPQMIIPRDGIFYCGMSIMRSADTTAVQFHLYKNGSSSAIDCTSAATSTASCYDTDGVAVVAGDRVAARTTISVASHIVHLSIFCMLTPTHSEY